jgi:hypothetical protein
LARLHIGLHHLFCANTRWAHNVQERPPRAL